MRLGDVIVYVVRERKMLQRKDAKGFVGRLDRLVNAAAAVVDGQEGERHSGAKCNAAAEVELRPDRRVSECRKRWSCLGELTTLAAL